MSTTLVKRRAAGITTLTLYRSPNRHSGGNYSRMVPCDERAWIDVQFVEECEQYRWTIQWRSGQRSGYPKYARARVNGRDVKLQLFVWDLSGRSLPVYPLTLDHVNRDIFDNRLSNLRIATRSQQSVNQSKREGTSQFRGAHWHVSSGRWQARATVAGRVFYLLCSPSEVECGAAYNHVAIILYGPDAQLNTIPRNAIQPDRLDEIHEQVERRLARRQ